MRTVLERCLRSAGAMVLLCTSAACGTSVMGDDDGPGPGQDGGTDSPSGHDIRVELATYPGTTPNDQLVAILDGDGAWVAMTGKDNVYTAHIDSERYGVAIGCVDDELTSDVQIFLQTISDGTTVSYAACARWAQDQVALSGAFSGLATGENLRLWAKYWTSSNVSYDDATWRMTVLTGKTELFASATSFEPGMPGKLIRKRGLDVTGDMTFALDFAKDGVAFETPALTGDAAIVGSSTSLDFDGGHYQFPSYWTQGTYRAIPASLRRPGDLQLVRATASDGRQTTIVGADGSVAVELAAPYHAPLAALIDDGYLRPALTFPIGGATLPLVQYEAFWFTFNETSSNQTFWDVMMTPGWAGDVTKVDYIVPDLSGLAGFDERMAPERHQAITGATLRYERTSRVRVAGTREMSAQTDWTLGEYCGDGVVTGGELCDDGGDSATCTASCMPSSCGDGYVNYSAGEECDPADGTTCDDQCHLIIPDGSLAARTLVTTPRGMTHASSSYMKRENADRLLDRRDRRMHLAQ